MPSRVALIGDLLLIAEAQLGTPVEELLRSGAHDSDSALSALLSVFDEIDPSASTVEEAAMCAVWIVRQRPFPRDNRQIGYRFMCSILDHADLPWLVSREDLYVIVAVFKALEAGTISEAEFVEWVCLRIAAAQVAEKRRNVLRP